MLTELIVVLAGFLCGFFNTVASSGSAVTLPLLLYLGLPPAVANGTNRLPVVLGAAVATISFIKAGAIQWPLALRLLLPPLIGSLVGAFIAEQIDPARLSGLIAGAVVMALLLLFTKIKKAFERTIDQPERYRWKDGFWLFLVGVWYGLIVLDGATYLLMVLVLSMRMTLKTANAYKNLIIFSVTSLSMIVFVIDGNINWEYAVLLAAGSMVGGYVGAKFAMHELAKKWTFRLLVGLIVLELAHMAVLYYTGMMMNV